MFYFACFPKAFRLIFYKIFVNEDMWFDGSVMIEKVIRKAKIKDFREIEVNLAFWLSKTPEERVVAVEYLRRQFNGSSARLQRSARVIHRSQS